MKGVCWHCETCISGELPGVNGCALRCEECRCDVCEDSFLYKKKQEKVSA